MRSIWKGHIRFSLVTIPIRIYNAVDTEETIRFNQLHKDDNGAVGYEKKCKKCGKALTTEEIAAFLAVSHLEDGMEEMLSAAEKRMGDACDNVTVASLRWEDHEDPAQDARSVYTSLELTRALR